MTDPANSPDPSWTVRRFAVWWLRSKPFNITGFNRSVHTVGPFIGVALYRHEQFQVQMFMAPPHTTAPVHSHPNVDSLEVWVGSDEKAVYWSEHSKDWFGMKPVEAGEPHTATIGDAGVCWLSIQKWLNGAAPTSVELDWVGEAIDDAHARNIGKLPTRPYAVMNAPWVAPRPDWGAVDDYKLPSAADWAEAFNLPHGDGIGGTDQ